MKIDEIKRLLEQFEAASVMMDEIECWSARNLQVLLGYTKWKNFESIIEKAVQSCKNAGQDESYHFAEVSRIIEAGKGAERLIDDILLTRYACNLILEEGDPKKQQIAFAQAYFAVPTRRAEIIEQRLLEYERVKARTKLA